MKKTLPILICSLFLKFSFAQDTIPNYSFEDWLGTIPLYWTTTNTFAPGSVARATDPHPAEFGNDACIVLTSAATTWPLTYIIPGIIANQAEVDIFGIVTGGSPFSARPDSLSGYYKYQKLASDTMSVSIFLSKWNSTMGRRDTIGYGIFRNGNNVPAYTAFFVPINYRSADSPDTMLIVAMSDYKLLNATANTRFNLDYLHFYPLGLGIGDNSQKVSNITVYPNPASEKFIVQSTSVNLRGTALSVYNVLGEKVMERILDEDRNSIDIRKLPDGIYTYRVSRSNHGILDGGKFLKIK